MKCRIQKYLSQHGILSRRKTEYYIQKGWIRVNGQVVTTLGTLIDPHTDQITLSEEAENERRQFVTLLFHKPKGIVTNCKQHDETEIIDLLPEKYRHLNAIGRLDKDSEGLIILTDNGVLATQFLNTDTPHERVYEVITAYPVTSDQLDTLAHGVDIGQYITKPCHISQLASRRIQLTLIEGKNRQIRRMLHTVGNRVHRLTRIAFGSYTLGDLLPGEYQILTT